LDLHIPQAHYADERRALLEGLFDPELILGLLAVLLVMGDRLSGASGEWTEML
jgi:hypothetical protein